MKKIIGFLSVMLMTSSTWAWYGMKKYGMMGGGGCGKAPLYLLIMALGYWLLRTAEAETKPLLKKVGRAVSWILLVVSLFGLLCPLFSCMKRASCPKMGMRGQGMPVQMQAEHPGAEEKK